MPDGERPEKVIKSYHRKVVGNMLFRKAEKSEAESIMALYKAVIGTPFALGMSRIRENRKSQAILWQARSTCWRKIIK